VRQSAGIRRYQQASAGISRYQQVSAGISKYPRRKELAPGLVNFHSAAPVQTFHAFTAMVKLLGYIIFLL